MAFRYPLQTLLRLREGLERQEERRLLAAAAVVARLRVELEQFWQEELQAARLTQQEMMVGSSAAVIRFAELCRNAAFGVRKSLEQKLAEAERQRLQQVQKYQVARQKREILEGLRQRQEAAYQLEFARREQQIADEAFLIRVHAEPDE